MSATTTLVTIGTTGIPYAPPIPLLEVFTPYAASLVEWFATGNERTHTFRAMVAEAMGERSDNPVDITVAREHVAFILTEMPR